MEEENKGKNSFLATPCEGTKIGKIIAVMSGKGGVGKSLVTELLAVSALRKGYRVGIMDADITGPSIPKAFGVTQRIYGDQEGKYMIPVTTTQGIRMVSMNLLLNNETDPVIWRGPVISGVIKQFYAETLWEEVDYMFVDMPPGTGDAPLTVLQSMPVDGIVVVTTPQDLVSMIVTKAVKMAKLMGKKVCGLVENMSYYKCPHCGEKLYPYGQSKIAEVASSLSLPVLGQIPIDETFSKLVDAGEIENADVSCLENAIDLLK